MVSFYPGPSKVYPLVPEWVSQAHSEGYLSFNHRSTEFEGLMRKTQKLLRSSLDIPTDYSCFFISSATECWEIIAQSLIDKQSLHIFNGAFGEKWFNNTQRITGQAIDIRYSSEEALPLEKLKSAELFALTHNETSNGTQIASSLIRKIKRMYPDVLLALDATSSMGGIRLPWEYGDVWFASVQKCLGLPAGMGLLVCSPQALEKARLLGDTRYYNSLIHLVQYMDKYQTAHTPNVLDIYLLSKVLESYSIKSLAPLIKERYVQWTSYIESLKTLKPFIENRAVRSLTVLTLKGRPSQIERVLNESKANGFNMGKGYGELKSTTLRIANFPAISGEEIDRLQKFWASREF